MIILIPLGGKGERFKKNNYTLPKALINVFGKPILFWLLDTLKEVNNETIIYIPYNKEYEFYRLESLLIKSYPNLNFEFFCLEKDTEGAAETINVALKHIHINDQPVICLDSDNFYNFNIVEKWNRGNMIVTFTDENSTPIYSYVEINDDVVIDIVEKEKISNYACTGAYGFESYKSLLFYTQQVLDNDIREKNEFYTSVVIKEMIKNNIQFSNLNIDQKDYICLGTPLQLKHFYNNYPKISCLTSNNTSIKPLRICFDFDNTLVTFPKKHKDYTSVEPIQRNIDFLKYLKSFGHTIIIYTARKMNSSNGNIGKVLCDVGKITFDTLDKYNIPFDEIYFGKPYAHYYIDDLAVNCFDDMEKIMGYYMSYIEPRKFNSIEENTIETITKRSENLDGEIFYYKNIPREIKDMFPILINYDDCSSWYTVEKIQGLSLSDYYLSEIMTKQILYNIMNSIIRIHSVDISNNYQEIDIYENYSKKLVKRYNSYDYSKFENSDEIFKDINNFLIKYEQEKLGKMCIVHGDTVLTNILVNKHDKIKFIDMRGKSGNLLTLYGDWLYDWAKLYQSLIGYDEILENKYVSKNYKKKLINQFEKYILKKYDEKKLEYIKMITKLLLFTLIPLHNNNKCIDYFNLISKIK
jgi:capsule biosynthesis phosphatase